MKPQTIIAILIIALIVLILGVWGYAQKVVVPAPVPASAALGAVSALTASENFYDFGQISMKNGNVSKDFTVTNSSDQDVTIATVVTSCMCTSALIVEPNGTTKGPFGMPGMGYVPPANEVLKAGASRVIRVIYNPNAHGPAGLGAIDRVVTLTDAAGNNLKLEIKAEVTP